MAEYSDLFLLGDDLESVLEVLETDDNIDEYFDEAVTEVSVGICFLIYNKDCGVCDQIG